MRRDEAGFTIPELLIVIILTAFFTTLLFSFVFQYLEVGYISDSSLETLVSRLNAGDYLRESVGTSAGLITQNSIADPHANVPDPSVPSGNYWLPIHAVPKTITAAKGSYTPVVYYRRYSVSTSGSYVMNGVQPYQDEYVLYLDGTNQQLLVRTLANPSASSNRAVTSCPPSSATATCPADKVLARSITSVNTRYFSRTDNTIDYTSSTDPNTGLYNGPDYTSVEAVEFTLNFSVKPLFEQTNAVTTSTVVRIALRNF